jgi:hypothetical protein
MTRDRSNHYAPAHASGLKGQGELIGEQFAHPETASVLGTFAA